MHFDALCLACMRQELEAALCPGRVQQIVLAGRRALGLEIYARGRRHSLLIQAEAADPRIHLVAGKVRRGPEGETPLLLLLRKYVRDALLVAVRQPAPWERLLELDFEHREHGNTSLIVELTGRTTNLLLLDARRTILDCLTRVPESDLAPRLLLPGRPYAPPPALNRLPPVDDATPDYYARLADVLARPGPLWRALTQHVAGVSPTQAREIVWRAAGDAEADGACVEVAAAAAALQEVWSPLRTGAWQPGVWRKVQSEEGSSEQSEERSTVGRAAGFAPVAIHAESSFLPMASLSAAIEAWIAARGESAVGESAPGERDAYAEQRRTVILSIQRARLRVERQIAALAGDEPAPGAADALRRQAEWLLAYSHTIAPGQTLLHLGPEITGEVPLSITLDPLLSPVAQAQVLFRKAGKWDRAARFIPERRARLVADLEYLAQLEVDAAQATQQPDLAAVQADLAASGLLPRGGRVQKGAGRAERAAKSGPRLFQAADGSRILVGRHARQNDHLTFDIARPRDHWLHARGVPGSHVVVQGPPSGREPDAEALRAAAMLAAWYSAARGETTADVIVTRRRHVSRAPGGHPGQVLVREEEVLRVAAQMPKGVTAK